MSHELVDGRFRIGHVIGKGNMGEVHRAEDLNALAGSPERMVALKTILRRRTGLQIDTGADPKAVERFAREVRIMRRLHDPHLTRLVAGGVAEDHGNLPYLAMELLDGETLRDLIACRATDERTMIASVFPRAATPDGTLLMLPTLGPVAGLLAGLSSFILDFAARQKVGGTHLRFFTAYQLPLITPAQVGPHQDFILPRVLELTYAAHDMKGFATHLGDTGMPFRWDESRRQVIRAELDALFFHLYGISHEDADYILGTFPIVRRKDEASTARTAPRN